MPTGNRSDGCDRSDQASGHEGGARGAGMGAWGCSAHRVPQVRIRVGLFGTSWWAEAMYRPALAGHPDAEVVAVCGRHPSSTRRSSPLGNPRIATANDSRQSAGAARPARRRHRWGTGATSSRRHLGRRFGARHVSRCVPPPDVHVLAIDHRWQMEEMVDAADAIGNESLYSSTCGFRRSSVWPRDPDDPADVAVVQWLRALNRSHVRSRP